MYYTCYRSTRGGISPDKIIYISGLYRENPEQVDSCHDELLELEEQQNRLFLEAISQGNYDYTPPEPVKRFITGTPKIFR